MTTYPVISIKQPWAKALLLGFKTIEIRTWRPNYTGPILLHASGNVDTESLPIFNGSITIAKKDTGIIFAKAYLSGFIDYQTREEFDADFQQHRNLSHWFDGRQVGWRISSVQAITPIACKGKLGLWRYALDEGGQNERLL